MSLYNAGSSAGNIIGPLLFTARDAPGYKPGLRKVLAIFVTLVALTGIQAVNLMFLNKRQERKRVAAGKPAKIEDLSMSKHYQQSPEDVEGTGRDDLGGKAFLDLPDGKNDEFVYLY